MSAFDRPYSIEQAHAFALIKEFDALPADEVAQGAAVGICPEVAQGAAVGICPAIRETNLKLLKKISKRRWRNNRELLPFSYSVHFQKGEQLKVLGCTDLRNRSQHYFFGFLPSLEIR